MTSAAPRTGRHALKVLVAAMAVAPMLSAAQAPPSQIPIPAPQPTPATAAGRSATLDRAVTAAALLGLAALWKHAGTEAVQRPPEETRPQGEDGPPPQPDPQAACKCTSLGVDVALDDDKAPKVSFSGAVNESQPSILDLRLDAEWLATLVCGPGNGGCTGGLRFTVGSSIRIDGKVGYRVPGKGEKDPPKGAGAGDVTIDADCRGACAQKTTVTHKQSLSLSFAHDELRKRGGGWEGNGHINRESAAYAGTIVITAGPAKCHGSGAKLVLVVGGSGTPVLKEVRLVREGDLMPMPPWDVDEKGKLVPRKALTPATRK